MTKLRSSGELPGTKEKNRCITDSIARHEEPLYHYILVRSDIPFGDIAAQVTHAAGESAAAWAIKQAYEIALKTIWPRDGSETPPTHDQVGDYLDHLSGWRSGGALRLPENTHAVVLAAQNEQELLDLSTKLTAARIPHTLIREPDAPFNGAATAVGIQPMHRRKLKKFLGRYSLLRAAKEKS